MKSFEFLLPERNNKPRDSGFTMVLDKGLGLENARSLMEICGEYVDFLKYIVDKTDVCKNMYMKYATMYDVDTGYEDVRMMFRCLKVCNTFENWLTNDFKIITYYAKIMEIDAFDLFFMYFSKHRPCSSEQFINFLKNTIDNLQSNDNNRHK